MYVSCTTALEFYAEHRGGNSTVTVKCAVTHGCDKGEMLGWTYLNYIRVLRRRSAVRTRRLKHRTIEATKATPPSIGLSPSMTNYNATLLKEPEGLLNGEALGSRGITSKCLNSCTNVVESKLLFVAPGKTSAHFYIWVVPTVELFGLACIHLRTYHLGGTLLSAR